MEKFAFMIHPIELSDIYRKLKFMEKLPEGAVEGIIRRFPPLKISHITGVKSQHSEAEGYFVACPLTTKQMMQLPEEYVIDKIIKTGKLAEKLGAKILGLGAFTAVVGDAGITVAKNLNIPVTTGNSYTVATAIEGAKKASEIMGKNIKDAQVLIIGATGSIGNVCAQILAKDCKYMTLAGRNTQGLESSR